MSARLVVDLPASMGPTMAVLATFALVLGATASGKSGPMLAARKADEVKKKVKRLYEEVQGASHLQAELVAMLDKERAEDPGSIADSVERSADGIDKLRTSFLRCEQAARMLEAAIAETESFSGILDRMYPGWTRTVPTVRPLLDQLRQELSHSKLVTDAAPLRADVEHILLRSLAEQGLREWDATLPSEEEPLFDEVDVQPIHWDPAVGWVEGTR